MVEAGTMTTPVARRDARAAGIGRRMAAVALLCLLPAVAQARSLTDIFRNELGNLQLEPVGDALAATVASTYPVASASSSVTYVYDPATDTFERQTRVLGPIFGERAETLGARQFDVSLSYSYVKPTSINGTDLDDLVNVPVVDGRVVSFPIVDANGNPSSVVLADGRRTTFLPIRVQADLDVEAQILAPSFTYGVTADLDVNLTLPLLRTYLRAEATSQVPDPRLPQFALPTGDPNMQTVSTSGSETAVGVGDLLLRAKYVFQRGNPVDVAAGLGLSLPTGDEDDLAGSGTTRVQPALIASRVFLERIEPLLNLGVDLNCDDVDRSVFVWAVGATARLIGPLTGALVFLGRNEFSAQADPIETPFFLQIERNDIYDVSIGFRVLIWDSLVLAANVLVPLNDEGLRADAVPTAQLEYEFSAPW